MFQFFCKCKWQTLIKREQKCPALHNLQSLKSICSSSSIITTSTNQHSSFTLSYLNNSCELSDETLNHVSIMVRLKSSKKPYPVLNFLQSRGLSQTQIGDIICRYPGIVLVNVGKTLKPKIGFLLSLGVSEAELNKIITTDPCIFSRSLKNQIIPCIDYLKTTVDSEHNAVAVIKRYPGILRHSISKYLAKNVSTLQNFGVPKSRISKLITWYPKVITTQPRRFSEVVLRTKEMGFDPLSSAFVHAVHGMTSVSELTWEGKFDLYRRLGFSDDEIISMFKKSPFCLIVSEEKIRRAVEFFVNKFCWSPSLLSTRPNVLLYSLEKRIIPRCSVLQVLVSRNRIKSRMVSSLLMLTEKDFLQKYVTKYKNDVPEVLNAHQGKLIFDEYNFESGGIEEATAL